MFDTDQTKPHEYFIEIVEDIQLFVVKKRIDQHIEQCEEVGWIKSKYPDVILVIPKSSLKKKIHQYIESLIENGYVDEDEMRFSILLLRRFTSLSLNKWYFEV